MCLFQLWFSQSICPVVEFVGSYTDDTTLTAESEEALNSLLMKVKEKSEKNWLKAQHSENEDHGIWSQDFMGNIWGKIVDSVRLYFWGLQNHCRW